MTVCPECRRDGRHLVSCSRGRCQRCKRYPATVGPWCAPCWKAVRQERERVVREKLSRLDGQGDG